MNISLTFLGTGAGLSPTLSRACSATLLNIGNQSCLIDCAEGTHLQLTRYRNRYNARNKLLASQGKRPLSLPPPRDPDKIFITHMHLDHCIGIPVLLRDMLSRDRPTKEPIEIYGPQGLRSLIRTTFKLTSSTILREERYRVHEILARDEEHTPCGPEELHHNEIAAEDIRPDSEGLWRDFCVTPTLRVSAAPIVHRVPCIGYVFQETKAANPTPRKVVMLGDTSDPSLIRPLAQDADILLHEATLASVAPDGKTDNPRYAKEAVTERAISRGHSTAEMAGQFAHSISARVLALNHFSARYPGGLDDPVMKEIESQASAAGVRHVKATHDLLALSLQLDKAGEPQWTEL